MTALAAPRALGHAAAAVRPFRMGSRTHLAVVAKAMFRIAHKQPMTPLPPAPIVVDDVPSANDPRASLAVAAENAPYLPRTDVLFLAQAWARGQAPVPLVPVRFRVGIENAVLLDKAIHVYGDRRGRDPDPFVAMPLVYERALGGSADPENPAGRDPRAGALPNLIDPHRPHRAIGVGPIAPHWHSRIRLLGQIDPRAVDAAWPSLPDRFDWSFFQCAPADQQIAHLTGREWIVLEGVSPHLPRIDACLPGPVAGARVWLAAGRAPEPVPLMADMLIVDANQGSCAVVWRGHVEVAEQALSTARVAVAVTLPGEEVRWEEPATAAPSKPKKSRTPMEGGAALAGSGLSGGLPFATTGAAAARASAPSGGLPFSAPSAKKAADLAHQTLDLGEDTLDEHARAIADDGLPFAPSAAAPERASLPGGGLPFHQQGSSPGMVMPIPERLSNPPVVAPVVAPIQERAPTPKVALPSYALKQQAFDGAHAPFVAPLDLDDTPPPRSERPRRKKRAPRAPLRPEERPKSAPLVPPRKRRPAKVDTQGVGASFLKAAEKPAAAPARGGA